MIEAKDIDGFFADPSKLNLEEYVLCESIFETSLEPRLAAAALCSEQSTAQWSEPHSSMDLRTRFGAKVISLDVMKLANTPLHSFPWITDSRFFVCKVTIAHPWVNFGPRIPNLLSAIAGEGAFYCPGINTLRVMDLHFPPSYLSQFQGPQFGVEGLRNFLEVYNRPFFVGVVKPNLGLTPARFAELAAMAWEGGLDMAKDDEMQANTLYSPIEERMALTSVAMGKAVKATGKKKIIIANITDDADELLRLCDGVVSRGANAVMVNPFFTGLGSVTALRRKSKVPIMGHFAGMALFDRIPHFGIEGRAHVKLMRLAGCDMIGLSGFGSRMKNSDETVKANIDAALAPMGPIKASLSIAGGSDWAGTLKEVRDKVGHNDFGFIAGRGVFGHPDGPAAGAASLVQAWEAYEKGIPLKEYAQNHGALRAALEAFSH